MLLVPHMPTLGVGGQALLRMSRPPTPMQGREKTKTAFHGAQWTGEAPMPPSRGEQLGRASSSGLEPGRSPSEGAARPQGCRPHPP